MTILKNGLIHDMIRKEPYQADILVKDGKIRTIGTDLPADEDVIDCAGADM